MYTKLKQFAEMIVSWAIVSTFVMQVSHSLAGSFILVVERVQ